jgi:hypothetical protein
MATPIPVDYRVLENAAPASPWGLWPADFVCAFVEVEGFDWLPETELELHALSASVPPSSMTSAEPRRRTCCMGSHLLGVGTLMIRVEPGP